MNNYDYPIGADTSDAPWNQNVVDYDYIPVSADAIVTIYKSIRSYAPAVPSLWTDEDGMSGYDYELADDIDNDEVYAESDNSFENEVAEIARLTFLLSKRYPDDKDLASLVQKVTDLKDWEVEESEIDNLETE